MAYMETPQTDAGNATYMSNAFNLDNFSVENSFLSPSKHKDDLISQLRKGREASLKTPRSRVPLKERRNLPTASRGEFTPMLQSAVKNNVLRKAKLGGGPETPAFLKNGYVDANSVAIPPLEASGLHSDDTRSSAEGVGNGTPVPRFDSSSAAFTPLSTLPKRDAGGVLTDQGNVITLREQENIISKIEKENFGLKLKIHFLEEGLHKAGPGFNEAALRENTTLKVDRVTLQKELARARKTLTQAERELENYRHHLQDVQEEMKRKHLDEDVRQELDSLKREVISKQSEVEDLTHKLETAEGRGEEFDKAQDELEELEADLRLKEDLLDQRDNEIAQLHAQVKKDAKEMTDLYEELETGRDKIKALEEDDIDAEDQAAQLKDSQDELQRTRRTLERLEKDFQAANDETENAKQDAKRALEAKELAEHDLNELRDEISNKSMNSKGLSRQLEEKSKWLQDDLNALRTAHGALEQHLDDKSRELKKAQEMISDKTQNAEAKEQRLQDQIELLRHQNEVAARKHEHLEAQVQQANKELRIKSEEKDLLHSRHDSLTIESQALQRDLAKALRKLEECESTLEQEKEHALENDRQLRAEANEQIEQLSDEIFSLRRDLEDKETQDAALQDHLESQRRALESEKEKLKEQAVGLQRTVDKLQETEGTLSDRDLKLKEALESEKQRFKSEEAVLSRQIQDLKADIVEKRRILDETHSELSETKDQLRTSRNDQADLEDKVELLEEELQSGLDEEAERADKEIEAAKKEAEVLRHELQAAKDKLLRVQTAHADSEAQTSLDQQLPEQIRDLESRLARIQQEKQVLQDKLAAVNIELRSLRGDAAETEAERDELKSQMRQMQDQVDETFRLDQEKLDLRKARLRLENDVGRLREERKTLIGQRETVERELEEEIERSGSEAGILREEIAELQRKLASTSGSRDRELSALKHKVQHLENHVAELETRLAQRRDDLDNTMELSDLVKDLASTRSKETEYLQREATYKGTIRDLKQEVTRLERQVHEIQISRLASHSPQSSAGGSARKDEIIEVRRQLAEAHQQMKDLRTKSKGQERELQRKVLELREQAQSERTAYEQERDHLEQELSSCRLQNEEQTAKATAAENAAARLRTRIQSLEKDIQTHRLATAGDLTMADERKDLHEMLKDAKLTVETLQVEISSREALLAASTAHEKELATHLARLREERTLQLNKGSALTKELEHLQKRYERAVDNFARQQKDWEEERRKITSSVRFPNMSISSLHEGNTAEETKSMEVALQEKERRHMAELKGLSTQIMWLRARWIRERNFREGLAHGKQYLLAEIETHDAFTKKNLAILSRIGVKQRSSYPPSPLCPHATHSQKLQHKLDSIQDPAEKKPSLKAVSLMIIAGTRMQRMAKNWAKEKNVKAGLLKGLENVRRRRKEREAATTVAAAAAAAAAVVTKKAGKVKAKSGK